MREKLKTALRTIAKLSKMETRAGFPLGEPAKDLTEDEAARIGRRLERAGRHGVVVAFQTDGAGRRLPARAIQHVAGRNDPCPCGSAKKYKKCCGFVQPSGPRVEAMPLSGFLPGIDCTGGRSMRAGMDASVAELEGKIKELGAEVAPPLELEAGVDVCEHMLGTAAGSCARCEWT